MYIEWKNCGIGGTADGSLSPQHCPPLVSPDDELSETMISRITPEIDQELLDVEYDDQDAAENEIRESIRSSADYCFPYGCRQVKRHSGAE